MTSMREFDARTFLTHIEARANATSRAAACASSTRARFDALEARANAER
jgi:hypothetical protein